MLKFFIVISLFFISLFAATPTYMDIYTLQPAVRDGKVYTGFKEIFNPKNALYHTDTLHVFAYTSKNANGSNGPRITATPGAFTFYKFIAPAGTTMVNVTGAITPSNTRVHMYMSGSPNLDLESPLTHFDFDDTNQHKTVHAVSGESISIPLILMKPGPVYVAFKSEMNNAFIDLAYAMKVKKTEYDAWFTEFTGSATSSLSVTPAANSGKVKACSGSYNTPQFTSSGASGYSWSIDGPGIVNASANKATITYDTMTKGTLQTTIKATDSSDITKFATSSFALTVESNSTLIKSPKKQSVAPGNLFSFDMKDLLACKATNNGDDLKYEYSVIKNGETTASASGSDKIISWKDSKEGLYNVNATIDGKNITFQLEVKKMPQIEFNNVNIHENKQEHKTFVIDMNGYIKNDTGPATSWFFVDTDNVKGTVECNALTGKCTFSNLTKGDYNITVSASNGSSTATATVNLHISPFTIVGVPASFITGGTPYTQILNDKEYDYFKHNIKILIESTATGYEYNNETHKFTIDNPTKGKSYDFTVKAVDTTTHKTIATEDITVNVIDPIKILDVKVAPGGICKSNFPYLMGPDDKLAIVLDKTIDKPVFSVTDNGTSISFKDYTQNNTNYIGGSIAYDSDTLDHVVKVNAQASSGEIERKIVRANDKKYLDLYDENNESVGENYTKIVKIGKRVKFTPIGFSTVSCDIEQVVKTRSNNTECSVQIDKEGSYSISMTIKGGCDSANPVKKEINITLKSSNNSSHVSPIIYYLLN